MFTPKQIEIRRADPSDAATIAAVLHKAFIEFKHLYTEGGFAAMGEISGLVPAMRASKLDAVEALRYE